jgi:hypothetical protein
MICPTCLDLGRASGRPCTACPLGALLWRARQRYMQRCKRLGIGATP